MLDLSTIIDLHHGPPWQLQTQSGIIGTQSAVAGPVGPLRTPIRCVKTPVTDGSLSNISETELDIPGLAKLAPARVMDYPPRVLLLYGSLRERSYRCLLALEAERLLQSFGAETRVFDPSH
jgi:hypothetical protein